ncbi:MAG: protein-L-isoaspartate(D-aspartate) O-methyltransferase [Deltaproteobacteria bacterium]|nr:protein-L-isoaspartate(D-aspartate) O-methyltransferase [Deltaproteobacteria bacterium]
MRAAFSAAGLFLVVVVCRAAPPAEQEHARRQMVQRDLKGRDIVDPAVLAAMGRVPRHLFVEDAVRWLAYDDRPLPIGQGQTISQPYIVALMTQLARPQPRHRALEVGTGSGYQAAVLAELVQHVYTIEILCPLADRARTTLAEQGYRNVTVRCGNGYAGWKEHAPFDVILVTAAPDAVPRALLDQLAVGGRMVIPVGAPGGIQQLRLITRQADGTLRDEDVLPVRFVPMTGSRAP